MKGWVEISDFEVNCIIGLLAHEREKKQDVHIDISYQVDLEKTIDYVKVTDLCQKVLVEGKFELLETAASTLLQTLTTLLPYAIKVRVKKPHALAKAAYTAVEVER